VTYARICAVQPNRGEFSAGKRREKGVDAGERVARSIFARVVLIDRNYVHVASSVDADGIVVAG
jgi:hypothetical protein